MRPSIDRPGRLGRRGLQQGPSSLPASQAHLLEWTGRFAERIRGVGARRQYTCGPPRMETGTAW